LNLCSSVLVYAITLARSAPHLRDPATVHPKYVQQSVGHTSNQLTLDRYSHRITSMG
jgi:hypothetical protein